MTGELIERTQVDVTSENVKPNKGKLECEFESELESERGLSRSRDGKMLVTDKSSRLLINPESLYVRRHSRRASNSRPRSFIGRIGAPKLRSLCRIWSWLVRVEEQ